MGLIFRQSIKNTAITYFGFLIGAINTLFLYTSFLSKEQYGLVSYVFSVGNILTPILIFGVGNTLIKYYFSYNEEIQRNRFVTFMFFIPILIILIGSSLTYLSYNAIYQWISKENEVIKNYVWAIFGISVVMAYFEVFYAWARVQLKTVEGNFLREVFPRLGIFLSLYAIHLQIIDFELFITSIWVIYFFRMILMCIISFRIKMPKLVFGLPKNYRITLTYSLFLLIAGSVSTLLVDIDKFMLNFFLPLDQIAIYTVAVFIATVIVVPYRSMYQLISPIVAKLINENNRFELEKIYQQGTRNLFLAGGFVFLLITLNINDLYNLIPSKGYEIGAQVLFLISVVKLSDSLTGMSNAVLLNASYYRLVLYLGLFLVGCTVAFNCFFIPKWGINGAALATFIAFSLYNSLKIYFVYRKDNLHPFSEEVLRISGFLIITIIIFHFLKFPFSPILNIFIRSFIISVLLILCSLYFKFSPEFTKIITKSLSLASKSRFLWIKKTAFFLLNKINSID